ncbi:MAG: CPBP family intramembrane metalloprotease [archaeon]|nr:CPBP family intramembrane metalloprotease [archaeon]
MDFDTFRSFPKDLALSSSLLIIASIASYFILLIFFNYTYELLLSSNIIFVILGLSMLALRGFRGNAIFRLLYIIAILSLSEEVLLNSAFAWYGLALAFLGFVLLPLSGAIFESEGEEARVVLEVCGLLFATRIVFSPFPINLLMSASILPAIYTLVMMGIVFYLWFRRIPLTRVGFKRGLIRLPFQILAGIFIGAVLGLMEYPILRPQPVDIGPNMLHNALYLIITMMVFVGLTEELLFRGLLQNHMQGFMPRWQAVHLTSLIFALFHIGWLNPLEVVFAYGAGVVFGYMLIKTDSLIAPTFAHGFGNIMLYTLAQIL